MRANEATPTSNALLAHRAGAFTYCSIALGSMVCATDSSSACPAWPVCYADQIGPNLQGSLGENPMIEFVHRLIAFVTLCLIAATALRFRRHQDRRLRVLPWIALAGAIASAIFGMMIILFHLPLLLGILDLFGALLAMTMITISAEAASGRGASTGNAAVRGTAWATLGTLVVMHLAGLVVAGKTQTGDFMSYTRCLGWPMWQVLEVDRYSGLQLGRIVLAVGAAVLLVVTVIRGLRDPRLRRMSMVLAGLFVLELVVGLVIRGQGIGVTQTNGVNQGLAVLYSVTAASILWALGYVIGRSYPRPDAQDAPPARPDRARVNA